MFNVQQITSRLSMMSDAQLAQYARLHKDDPYILPMAAAEAKRRQQTRQGAAGQQAMQQATQPTIADQNIASMQLPEDQGIGVLPAQNIEGMADGGIAGYAEGGVAGYATGGDSKAKNKTEEYRAYALRKAREMGLDPKFVDGIFQIESEYTPHAKSKTGPVGIGQLTKATAQAFGLAPKERVDPYKNMDTSMALMKYLFGKYKDPAKVAIAYNQGEGVLNDHLKKNKGKLVPEKLYENVRTRNKQEPLNYLKKLNNYIPIPAAAAADMPPRGEAKVSPPSGAPAARGVTPLPTLPKEPAATPAPEPRYTDLPADVPTPERLRAEEKARREAEPSWLAKRGRELAGAPEAGLSALTGAISPLTGTVYAAGRTLAGTPTTAEEGFGAMTFAPRSEYGKESLSEMHRAFEDFKIPPFIPGVGTTSARSKSGKAVTAAELAEAEAARAAQAAETAKAPRLEGPKSQGAGRASDLQQRFAEAQERSAKALETADLLATSVVDGKLMTGKQKAAALRASMPKTEGFTPDPAAQNLGVEALLRRKRAEQAKDVMRAKEDAAKAARKAEEAAVIAEREKALDRGDATFAGARRQAEAQRNIFAPGVIGSGAGVRAPVPEPSVEGPPVSDAYPDETMRGIKPGAGPEAEITPDKLEAAKELGQQVLPKSEGFSNEDYVTMGLNMMMAQPGQPGGALSQLASNVGRSGIATLQARRERELRQQEKDYKDVMKGYYGKLTETYGRPEAEERQVLQIMKDNPGMRYEEAVRRLYDAKYASRGETTLEAARLRNPFLALYEQGLMEPGGGLTPQGQSIFNKYFPKQ